MNTKAMNTKATNTKTLVNTTLLNNSLSTQPSSKRAFSETPTTQPDISELSRLPPHEGETIRHILLGTPGGVRQTIHLLHTLRYVENVLWSPLVPIPNDQLIITPRQGDVMSILVKHLR